MESIEAAPPGEGAPAQAGGSGRLGERAGAGRADGAERVNGAARMPRDARREALLDAAAALVAAGEVDSVSMETVAEVAAVSRPLVYKHFANRADLLAAVYRREASRLHAELSAAVAAESTIEGKFRALIRGALRAQAERGASLAALGAAGARTADLRRTQRDRNRNTVRHFARQAVAELGVDERKAKVCLSIVLRAIDGVLAEWRQRPTPQFAAALEDAYVTMAMGTLEKLAR
ncbi:MAG TPA: TetR family transcriptional regulator [Acidimicrobiales bacterium]|nr:TetR family transcriptional regulator [Acidimicrobiales bacterium]